MNLEQALLQIQNDVGDVFDDALDDSELVLGSVNLDRRDGPAFERAEENATEGIANGMAVTGFKRFGNESLA